MKGKLLLGLLLLPLFGSGQASIAAPAPARNVVLVHGAFADESSWDKVARLLRAKGYRVTQVANPLTSLADDVAATRRALSAQKGPTVLVGHSWGGVVIGEAGDAPNVASLVYVAAFAPDRGESVQDLGKASPPTEGQRAIRPDAKGFLTLDPVAYPRVFMADVPVVQASRLANRQRPINAAAFATRAEVAAWHDKPVYYAVSADDRMLPAPAEDFFARRMKARTVTIPASHASPLSHPAEIAALIERAARLE